MIDDEVRKSRVGASEASALVGIHPHISAIDVYNRLVHGTKPEDNDVLAIGRALEPAVVELYARKTGTGLDEISMAKTLHISKFPYLCATPDRIVNDGLGYRLLEVKTHSYFGAADEWGEPGTDEVPQHHAMQVQLTLAVTGFQVADLAVLFSGRDFRVYHISANRQYQDDAYEVIDEFYRKHVVTKTPPPPDGHEAYSEWLKREFPVAVRADVIEGTTEDENEIQKFLQWKAQMEHAEQKMLEARQYLTLRIGDASGLKSSSASISYRNVKNSSKTDWQAVAHELGASEALIKKYTKEVLGHRVFRVTSKALTKAA